MRQIDPWRIAKMGFYKGIINVLFRKKEDYDLSIEEASYVVMDTELTGLDLRRDSIISIGAIKMSGTGIDLGRTFHRLIKPATHIKPESIIIHGLTPSELIESPPLEEIIAEFIDFCGKDIVVGHFVSIDMHFLKREIKRICSIEFQNPYIDTSVIYRWIKENTGSFSRHYEEEKEGSDLFSIAREYGITVKEGHNALGDAFMTAQVFQRFLRILPGLGVRRVKELLRIGKP